MLKAVTEAKTVGALQDVEDRMVAAFKDLPQFPEASKESLAKIWPWIALAGGILQLLAAFTLYRLVNYASRLANVANSLSAYYTGQPAGPTSFDKTIIYLGILMLVIDSLFLLAAFPRLQKRQKSGWDLLFMAALANLVYGVFQIFTYHRGISSFIGSLVGSAIAFYLLFQVREKFVRQTTRPARGPARPVDTK